MQGSERVVDVWALRPGQRDNHLFDCLVGAAVAASIQGVALPNMEPSVAPVRQRIRFSDRRGGRQ